MYRESLPRDTGLRGHGAAAPQSHPRRRVRPSSRELPSGHPRPSRAAIAPPRYGRGEGNFLPRGRYQNAPLQSFTQKTEVMRHDIR